MSSHWTNKNAILRDLSVAQGREVPVETVNTVASNEKPPSLSYTEETEEEFLAGYVGSCDFETGPDIQLIQQMLDLVREVNITDIEDKTSASIEAVEVTKSDAQFPSQNEDVGSKPNDKKRNQKPKRKRNVAVASLIETYGDNMYTKKDNNELQLPNLNLLKPDDVIPKPQDFGSTESRKRETISKKNPIIQSPTSMFKKKTPNTKVLDNSSESQKKDLSPTSMTIGNDITVDQCKPSNFVPSSHAGQRYKEYLERSKMQELVNEDIWSKAERQMKEIDSKRKQE